MPAPATVTDLFPANVFPAKSSVLPLLMEIEETAARDDPTVVFTIPPAIVTGPVKLPATPSERVLLPFFKRFPAPLICPEPPNVKSFKVDSTTMLAGETVLLTVTLIRTPKLSSNRTESFVKKVDAWLVAEFFQSAVRPLSQNPVLLAFQTRLAGALSLSRNNLACAAPRPTLKELLAVIVVPFHKFTA